MPYKDKEKRRQAQRKYHQKHKKKINARKKKNKCYRLTKLGTKNGVVHGLHKRKYPKNNICELCKTQRKFLVYHHWDKDLNKGMWICNYCHCFVERHEKGFDKKYIKLKKKIEVKMPLHMKKQKRLYKKDAIKNLLKRGYKQINISKILNANKDYVCQVNMDLQTSKG